MGRLIDEDVLIDAIPDLNAFEEEDFCTSDMIRLIEDTPPVEAIPKDQYEARLKADMVAMLEELQLEIEELKNEPACCHHFVRGICRSSDIIQQKIDALKAESEDKDENKFKIKL